jgi:hypothetical protein
MATATNIHKPDVTAWTFDSVEDCVAGIKKSIFDAVQEVITLAQKDGAKVSFGIEWGRHPDDPREHEGSDGRGGPQIDDPMVLLIDLPLGPSEDDYATWRVSLGDAVDDLIGLYEHPHSGKITGFDAVRCASVRDALHTLADRINSRLKIPTE